MLCASEGLTFGLRPNALGLRSSLYFIRSRSRVKSRYTESMKIVLQKVLSASVAVENRPVSSIGHGYLLLTGIAADDTDENVESMAKKIAALRLFPGEDGKINDRTILEVGGSALVVSQFTLFGDVEKSNRPDYTGAGPRDLAERLYLRFADLLKRQGIEDVQTGRFGASMAVQSTNDGPVTLLIGR